MIAVGVELRTIFLLFRGLQRAAMVRRKLRREIRSGLLQEKVFNVDAAIRLGSGSQPPVASSSFPPKFQKPPLLTPCCHQSLLSTPQLPSPIFQLRTSLNLLLLHLFSLFVSHLISLYKGTQIVIRCTTSDLNNCHSTNSGIRAQESQKFEEQRQKPNLPRIQSAQNSILSTPKCSTRRKECTGENFTQIGATERPHARTRRLKLESESTRRPRAAIPPARHHHAPVVFLARIAGSAPTSDPKSDPRSDPKSDPVVQSDPENRPVPRSDPDRPPTRFAAADVTNAVITAGIFRQVKEYSVISVDFCQEV
ncbi:hypothetical protein LWI29_020648 [Acer saccharum]|uniref:Uncharacterized protein n=1 Tax=Acer saccharum TaxID=4024 RepID=A0AA39VP15_ACESA|nr:hypothetical protein LWI29_020648 [Acer saccharum]